MLTSMLWSMRYNDGMGTSVSQLDTPVPYRVTSDSDIVVVVVMEVLGVTGTSWCCCGDWILGVGWPLLTRRLFWLLMFPS